MNDGWEVKIDTIENCDNMPKEVVVWMEPLAKEKINVLMDKFPNIEWLAYLLGNIELNVIEDLHIPEQKITTTSVDDIECPEINELNIIGVIHSHHGMGNSFSQIDHEWINQNHNISICIANRGMAGQVRLKTPCGSLIILPAKIKIKLKSGLNKKIFLEEIDKKIEKKTYTHSGTTQNWKQNIKNFFQDNTQKEFSQPVDIKEAQKRGEEAKKERDTKSSFTKANANNDEWNTNVDKEDISLLEALKQDGLEDDINSNEENKKR